MATTWYLAELMEVFDVEGQDTSLLWVNWILVNADDAEHAYTKALRFGDDLNREHHNTDGDLVTVTFGGLRGLTEIYEDFVDGAEITYEEFEDISHDEIRRLVRPKEQLAVFRSREEK